MSVKINKNGKEYPIGVMPQHYPADRVYLDGDTTKNVQDELTISQQEASIIDTSKIFGVNSCKRYGKVSTVELRCNSYGISSNSSENIATIDAKYVPNHQIFFDVLCLDSNGYPNGTVLGTIATNGTVSIVTGSNAVTGFTLMVTYVI